MSLSLGWMPRDYRNGPVIILVQEGKYISVFLSVSFGNKAVKSPSQLVQSVVC